LFQWGKVKLNDRLKEIKLWSKIWMETVIMMVCNKSLKLLIILQENIKLNHCHLSNSSNRFQIFSVLLSNLQLLILQIHIRILLVLKIVKWLIRIKNMWELINFNNNCCNNNKYNINNNSHKKNNSSQILNNQYRCLFKSLSNLISND
jgi:hypothetical protein